MVFERCHENKRRTCRELGISYHTLMSYLNYRPEVRRRAVPATHAGKPTANREGTGAAGRPQRFVPDQSGGMQW
jgi:hypothetical protein